MDFTDLEYTKELYGIMSSELSDGRYKHVVSVARTAYILCRQLSLDDEMTEKTVKAGFLHDITREKSTSEQLEMCKKYGITLTDNELKSPQVLHQLTGAEYIKEKYPSYSDEVILDIIRKHCTGGVDMSTAEKIVFLSDYIEPERHHESCKRLHDFYFFDTNGENLENHLDKAVFLAYDNTVGHLKEKGAFIHPATLSGWDQMRQIIK